MDDAQENNASHSQKLHQMRITNHGKMHHFVEFALNHFKNNSDIPLSLHTCPAAKPSANELVELPKSANALDGGIPDATERRMLVSTTTIPRLISVVEIIKREYLKTLEITQSRVLSGLYQYNEIGYLEQHESDDSIPSEDRMQVLAMALEGKNHPKQKKSVYMRITLSKGELPHLTKTGATFQSPSIRKQSKSARARARKRQMVGDAEMIT